MYCKFCGYKIDEISAFCSNCGNKLSSDESSKKLTNESLLITKEQPISNTKGITPRSKAKVAIATEIMENLMLGLMALIIACFSYIILFAVKQPKYIPQEEIDKNLKLMEESTEFYVSMGWLGYCEYDVGITKSELPYINDIRKNRFSRDIQNKTILIFIISLVTLIVGRYIRKGFIWAKATSEESQI